MPALTMPRPLIVVAFNLPVAATSPVSSTFTVVVPLPVIVNGPLTFLSVPPVLVLAALLPMLIVFVPRLALITVVLLVPVISRTSAPEPNLRLKLLMFE